MSQVTAAFSGTLSFLYCRPVHLRQARLPLADSILARLFTHLSSSFDEFGRVLSDTSPGFQALDFAGGPTAFMRVGPGLCRCVTAKWL